MAKPTAVAAALIGCDVLDAEHRRLGRVVAVIHRADGTDVLVEGRRWLRHRGHRFELDELTQLADGRLVVHPRRRVDDRREQQVRVRRVAGPQGR